MTEPRDPYWDDLGIAWCAIETDTSGILGRLQTRLRRQTLLMTGALALGLPVTAAGLVIGVMTLWFGWKSGTWNFLTRGAAIVIISGIALRGLWLLLPVRHSSNGEPLSDMLALAVARGERMLTMIRLALSACVIAAVFGLIGTALRHAFGRPPALSPVIDLAVLAIVALMLSTYLRQGKINLAKFQYLKRTITSDPAEGPN
jgi:hypothetical protein